VQWVSLGKVQKTSKLLWGVEGASHREPYTALTSPSEGGPGGCDAKIQGGCEVMRERNIRPYPTLLSLELFTKPLGSGSVLA
jgi:hypothetical protein